MADSLNTATLADPRPALSSAEVAALGEHLGEETASVEARRLACEGYLDAGLPDRVNHLWRFTDPVTLLPASLGARVLAGADVTPADLPPVEGAAATIDLWPGRAPAVNLSAGIDPATLTIGVAILFEAGLSFLGLGDPNVMSWGLMISESTFEVLAGYFNNFIAASVLMFGLVMAFSMFSDSLQDALDPRTVN